MKITPDRVKELARTPQGQLVLDALVAWALGWRRWENLRTYVRGWRRGDEVRRASEGLPPYVSGAPDAPDRWRWWGEMIDFLRTRFPDCDVVVQMYGDHGYSDDGSNHVCIYRPPPTDDKAERRPAVAGCVAVENDCGSVVAGREGTPAKSLSIALAATMAAAGLLEEIPDGE